MKAGDKVKIVDFSGLSGYKFYPKIKKLKTLTIRRVKPSGGILFNEIEIGWNIFGEEQGFLPHRLKVIKQTPRTPVKIIDSHLKKLLSKK